MASGKYFLFFQITCLKHVPYMYHIPAVLESIMSSVSIARLDVALDRFWHPSVSVQGQFLGSCLISPGITKSQIKVQINSSE